MIKKIVENRLIKDYTQNKDDIIKYLKVHNPSFAQLTKRKRDMTLQDLLEVFDKEEYIPSEYELETFSEVLGIKIILIGRKTIRHGQEIVCIKPKHITKTFVILHQDIQKEYDQYNIVVKNKQKAQIILNTEDFPDVSEYINKTCAKWYFVDMVPNDR